MSTYKGIQGYSVQKLSSDPSATSDNSGKLWYNSGTGKFKIVQTGTGAWASGGSYPQAIQEFPGSAGTKTAALCWCGYQQGAPYTRFSTEYDGTSWSPTVDLNRTLSAYTQGLGTQTAALSGGFYRAPVPTGVKTGSEEYDGSTWSVTNPTINALGKRNGCGIVTAGLEAGGDDIAPPAAVGTSESYDGTSWADVASLNTGRMASASHNGTLTASLCVGGATTGPTAVVANVEEFDGSTWTETTDVNTAKGSIGGAGTSALALVYGGGPSVTGATESWDGTTWTEVGDLATGRFSGGAAGTTNTGSLYVGGDLGPASSDATEVWEAPNYTIKTVTVS
jgi:hypothetical protein